MRMHMYMLDSRCTCSLHGHYHLHRVACLPAPLLLHATALLPLTFMPISRPGTQVKATLLGTVDALLELATSRLFVFMLPDCQANYIRLLVGLTPITATASKLTVLLSFLLIVIVAALFFFLVRLFPSKCFRPVSFLGPRSRKATNVVSLFLVMCLSRTIDAFMYFTVYTGTNNNCGGAPSSCAGEFANRVNCGCGNPCWPACYGVSAATLPCKIIADDNTVRALTDNALMYDKHAGYFPDRTAAMCCFRGDCWGQTSHSNSGSENNNAYHSFQSANDFTYWEVRPQIVVPCTIL